MVTTWDIDPSDAAYYFVHLAGGGAATLLALAETHPDVVALLEAESE